MLVEMRTYSFGPGGAADYLKAYNGRPRQLQSEILGRLLGLYQSEVGELNQLVFLWGFDSHDERDRRRRALMADAEFAEFRRGTRHLVLRQENRLLSAA
ncbi:NIPSNAP family protein [Ramlibacter sp. AW1]|uniref:NIPSNAP family protein n=1 Tax=Ramlibacter aurantiacus TaxID=2801330 RepID=A0A937D8C7_9BURK|nr:NIPSNAP family protein [Ramlibacter aurantiacus]MBL0422918.1 NIPSNAP family protein [Ramlibacter aurantiacus]